jgi:hypothetical protein
MDRRRSKKQLTGMQSVMRSLVKNTLAVLCMATFFNSCYYDNLEELHPNTTDSLLTKCDTLLTETISYSQDIVPILVGYCGTNNNACHSSSTGTGIILDNYNDVLTVANNGLLVQSITNFPGLSPMPKFSGTLNSCYVKKIEAWVNRGKLNN